MTLNSNPHQDWDYKFQLKRGQLQQEGLDAYNKKDMSKAAQIFSEALTPKQEESSKEVAKANALLKAGEVNKTAKIFRKIARKNTHPRMLPSYVGFGSYGDYPGCTI